MTEQLTLAFSGMNPSAHPLLWPDHAFQKMEGMPVSFQKLLVISISCSNSQQLVVRPYLLTYTFPGSTHSPSSHISLEFTELTLAQDLCTCHASGWHTVHACVSRLVPALSSFLVCIAMWRGSAYAFSSVRSACPAVLWIPRGRGLCSLFAAHMHLPCS